MIQKQDEQLDSRKLTEGYSAYNVFALGIKYLILHGHMPVDQLPKEFIAAASKENPKWQDRHQLYHWIYSESEISLYQLHIGSYLRGCFANEPSRRGSQEEVDYLARLFGIQVILERGQQRFQCGLDNKKQCFSIAIKGSYWQYQTGELPLLPRVKIPPRKKPSVVKRQFEDKQHDLACIMAMQQCLKNARSNIGRETLLELTRYCGGEKGISFDDGDEACYAIRNRYGLKIRSLGRSLNLDQRTRIDFEMLYCLKALIEADFDLPKSIQKDCIILQFKLNNILLLEKQKCPELFSSLKFDESVVLADKLFDDLTVISEFVNTRYPDLIMQKIKKEVQRLGEITVINKASVYKFARRFLLIGELFHEYGDLFPSEKNAKKFNLFSVFNRLNGIRNDFVHFDLHLRIIYLLNSGDQSVVPVMLALIESMCRLFPRILSLDTVISEDIVDDFKAYKEAIINFMALFSYNKKVMLYKKAMQVTVNANRILGVVDSEEFRGLCRFVRDHFTIDDKLEHALTDYSPSYLIKLISIPKIAVQLSANNRLECDEHINRVIGLMQNCQLAEIKLELVEFMEQSDIRAYLIEKFDSVLLPSFNSDLLKYHSDESTLHLKQILTRLQQDPDYKQKNTTIKKLYDYFSSLKGVLCSNVKFGCLGDQHKKLQIIKAEFNSLNHDDRDELQSEFNFDISCDPENREKIKALAEKQVILNNLKNPTAMFIKKLNGEMQYLSEIQVSNEPDKESIVEHIVTLVGQYIRDIEQSALDDSILLSQTAKMAAIQAKSARSKGLAHEVFHFDAKAFRNKLLRHIAPSQRDFEAVAKVHEASQLNVNMTSLVFDEVGDAYARLGLYQEAIQQYLMALKYSLIEDPEDQFAENSVYDLSRLRMMGVTIDTAVLIDTYKILFGVSIFEARMFAKVMGAHNHLGQTEEVSRLYELFGDRVNIKAISEYKTMLGHVYFRDSKQKPFNIQNASKQEMAAHFKKFPHYEERMSEIIKKITGQQRPFTILSDDEEFFMATADVFYEFGKACIAHHEYSNALGVLSHSYDLITGSVTRTNQGSQFHIATCDYTSVARYQLQIAKCMFELDEINMGDVSLATAFEEKNHLLTYLEAHCLKYWRLRGNSSHKSLVGHLVKCRNVFNLSTEKIKIDLGDQALDVFIDLHRVEVDYLIYQRQFTQLDEYLAKLDKDTQQEYRYDLATAFPDLYLSIATSFLSLLDRSFKDRDYFDILQRALHYYRLAMLNTYCADKATYDVKDSFKNKVAEYLKTYYTSSSIKDFLRLCQLLIENIADDIFVVLVAEYLCKKYPINSFDFRDVIDVAKTLLNLSEQLVKDKQIQKAVFIAKISHDIMWRPDCPAEFGQCCQFLANIMTTVGSFIPAIATLEHARLAYESCGFSHHLKDVKQKLADARKLLYLHINDLYKSGITHRKFSRCVAAINDLNICVKLLQDFEHLLNHSLSRQLDSHFNGLFGSVCYHLALSFQMMGDKDQAMQFAKRSCDYYHRNQNQYADRLQNSQAILESINGLKK